MELKIFTIITHGIITIELIIIYIDLISNYLLKMNKNSNIHNLLIKFRLQYLNHSTNEYLETASLYDCLLYMENGKNLLTKEESSFLYEIFTNNIKLFSEISNTKNIDFLWSSNNTIIRLQLIDILIKKFNFK